MNRLLSKAIDWGRRKSPWIIHFNAGACNGCDIEVVDALTPRFDIERFGLLQQGTPRHADVLVCTGAVTLQTRDRLKQIYEQMPEPKFVVAVGTCACTGGIFDGCYCVAGGIDSVIPVDIYLPGCAARPEALIDAIVKLLGSWEKRQRAAQETQRLKKPFQPPVLPPLAREYLAQTALPAAEPDPELVLAWQAIAACWGQMSEEEKAAAAELWRSLPAAERAAAVQATEPLADGQIPFAALENEATAETAADAASAPQE